MVANKPYPQGGLKRVLEIKKPQLHVETVNETIMKWSHCSVDSDRVAHRAWVSLFEALPCWRNFKLTSFEICSSSSKEMPICLGRLACWSVFVFRLCSWEMPTDKILLLSASVSQIGANFPDKHWNTGFFQKDNNFPSHIPDQIFFLPILWSTGLSHTHDQDKSVLLSRFTFSGPESCIFATMRSLD